MDNADHPLIQLYGPDAFKLVQEEIVRIAKLSNFPFDSEYLKLGIDFCIIKAQEFIDKNKKPSIHGLVSESFGEAAIYKFNFCGGKL